MGLNFKTLPDNTNTSIEPGRHNLTIKTAEQITTKNGCLALQCSYAVDNTKMVIKFDNYIISLQNGDDCSYGLSKLKKMMTAINVIPEGDFTIKTLIPLIIGKKFSDVLVKDKNDKYLVLTDNLNEIKPPMNNQPNQEKEPIHEIGCIGVSDPVKTSNANIASEDLFNNEQAPSNKANTTPKW